MNIQSINHITLRVASLEVSIPFYTEILGMELVHRGKTDCYLGAGSVWLCLLEKQDYQEISATQYGLDHVAFTVSEEDFHLAVEKLHTYDVSFDREPIFRGGGWSTQFRDPDGICLELFTGNLAKRMENWM